MSDRSEQTKIKMKAIIEFILIFILSVSLILLFMSGLYLLYALYYCNTLDQLTEVLTNPNSEAGVVCFLWPIWPLLAISSAVIYIQINWDKE